MSRALAILVAAGCGGSHETPTVDGSSSGDDASVSVIDSGVDGPPGTPVGTPMTCPDPGNPKHNGGSCGSERWNIKTGTDSGASAISLAPQSSSIATLVALPAAGGGYGRE